MIYFLNDNNIVINSLDIEKEIDKMIVVSEAANQGLIKIQVTTEKELNILRQIYNKDQEYKGRKLLIEL